MNAVLDSLYMLPLHHFKSYLECERVWSLVNENDRWIVYEDSDAIELAIPKNRLASDYQMNIDHFLKTLSFVQDIEPEAVADDIMSYDLDVFGAILDHSDGATSISMRSADTYFAELKQLLIYSASSEEKKEPFFRTTLPKARKLLDHFHFGHTVRGSFGYRIESKIKAESLVQFDLFSDEPMPIVPLERKVLERIYNGLDSTERAVNTGDMSILTEGYDSGLNANMCTAILNMAGDGNDTIEYNFKWSKRIPVSEKMTAGPKIQIGRDHLECLEDASEQLYRQNPACVSIEGLVTDLSSKGDPESEELGGRSITIQRLTSEGRSQKVNVVLDRDAYLAAIRAHRDWKTVGVQGYLEYKSSKWRLTNPEGFKILR